MKVAIIGSGISGMMVAEKLSRDHECIVYEKNTYLGGHTNTHEVMVENRKYTVDTGFIVCNRDVYKNVFEMFDRYEIQTQNSDMSFAVNNLESGLQYNATRLNTLFCQRKNLLNPKFYCMIKDIMRFYKQAPEVLKSGSDISLAEYLQQNNYSDYFIEEHIIPMASALWSGDFSEIKNLPLTFMLSFMKNHQMLQINRRPQWETVIGGSNQYIKALQKKLSVSFRLNTEVQKVTRNAEQVTVKTPRSEETYDYVFFCSHSDQTLKLLEQPSNAETGVLGDIPYVQNHIDLHTDASIMPSNKKAWASWVVNKYPQSKPVCTVNYWMNLLQNIDCPQPLIVSLNQSEHIDASQILKQVTYQHPVYNNQTIYAQTQKSLIQGKNRSYFCGAYWGWGFHEDGAKSAVEAVEQFNSEVSS